MKLLLDAKSKLLFAVFARRSRMGGILQRCIQDSRVEKPMGVDENLGSCLRSGQLMQL
jgi:hypothetical protein